MKAKLVKNIILFCHRTYLGLLLQMCFLEGYSQQCANSYIDLQNLNPNTINWSAFPDFSLPFKIIYGGPVENGDYQDVLNHGFTHLTQPEFLARIPASQRALIYYGTAYPNANQPWELYRSPWENNLNIYESKWKLDYNIYRNTSTGNSSGLLDADLFVFDIERQWRTDFEILQLKNENSISSQYRNLPESLFLKEYKSSLKKLYVAPLQSFRNSGISATTKIGSYADSPVFNIFSNIQGNSWNTWKTDTKVLNYLNTDGNSNLGGDFYNNTDVFFPSAYYYYDYPHPFAGEYLSYLLFQIEVNKAWTEKPVIPFVWLRYSFTPEFQYKFIKPWMAEATAIFPFFSGAQGLWLWDDPTRFGNSQGIETYNYFINGLARLAQFKAFFEGNHELVIQTSAKDYNENKKPIWRGVVKGNEILIAAHNPFAKSETEQVELVVSYNNWSKKIYLIGYETSLCVFDMTLLGIEKESGTLNVYPNPNFGNFELTFVSKAAGKGGISLVNSIGKTVFSEMLDIREGDNFGSFTVPGISSGVYFVRINIGVEVLHSKIVKF